ncbi:TraK family protein [Vibrio sp. 705]|uniref:TraK family protein n=1 Tax=Vibrio sp. 705 TaxID=3074611 RepID=UPI002965332B|nr:TraK family protein [Vibrio sp. 705]MDW1906894.1 TraK family protein [Vibrio sp. 705]
MGKAKKYTDQLAEWVKKRDEKRKRQDKNVVAFLAVQKDIEEAIAAGYSVKTIWEHMLEEGKIHCRYETFTKHVNRHIKNKESSSNFLAAKKTEEVTPEPPATKGPEKPTETKSLEKNSDSAQVQNKDKPKGITGFNFNSRPNKEDLI